MAKQSLSNLVSSSQVKSLIIDKIDQEAFATLKRKLPKLVAVCWKPNQLELYGFVKDVDEYAASLDNLIIKASVPLRSSQVLKAQEICGNVAKAIKCGVRYNPDKPLKFDLKKLNKAIQLSIDVAQDRQSILVTGSFNLPASVVVLCLPSAADLSNFSRTFVC
jgi:hypothetical protein